MALRKKPPQRRGAQNPNTVLVVFLVFFVLLSIGLGVWGYYGYAGQKEFETKAEKATASAKVAKRGEEWAYFCAGEARLPMGENLLKDADLDEQIAWENARKDFLDAEGKLNPGTKFKDYKNKDAIEKMIAENVRLLGWDAAGNKYRKTYREELASLQKMVDKLKGDVADAVTRKDEAEKKAQDMLTKYDPLLKEIGDQIKDGNARSLKASTERTAEMDKLQATIIEVRQKMTELQETHAQDLRKKDVEIRALREQVVKADGGKGDGPAAGPAMARPATGDVHALFLDVSQGRTLWDLPQGKILRVDPQGRRVYIDRGSAHGVKPQATFTVFAGWKGKAQGMLKGTVEVQNVLDANTSVANVTSLYDTNGREVPLGDTSRGVLTKEADNPLKEGDLLFNLAWGARVAIAGYVSWDGYDSDAPAEQMRHMQRFISLLRRQGVTVDAYMDLTDGQMKGALTPQTAYLIRGHIPTAGKDGDADAKNKLTKDLTDGRKAMMNEAMERGMFIISGDNFLNVIGYRRPHSASDPQVSDFRPGLPAAGSGLLQQQIAGKE